VVLLGFAAELVVEHVAFAESFEVSCVDTKHRVLLEEFTNPEVVDTVLVLLHLRANLLLDLPTDLRLRTGLHRFLYTLGMVD
jgi:hypothetical protein